MHLLVLGASGLTGTRIVHQALEAGHRVRAWVRDPARMPPDLTGLDLHVGDVRDPAAWTDALSGIEAVLGALGGRGPDGPGDVRHEGIRQAIAAMQTSGVSRLLAVGGAGVLQGHDGRLRQEGPTFPERFRAVSASHARAWRLMAESPLDWTFVCPPDLLDAPPSGDYAVAIDELPGGSGRIARGDLAAFMLAAAEENSFRHARVGINGL